MWIHWPFFPKTWTKGHWPLDDLWPHVCWGHMCDSFQGSLCPSPMTIHQCMWIQWSILQITTYMLLFYGHTTYRMSDHIVSYWTQFRWDNNGETVCVGGLMTLWGKQEIGPLMMQWNINLPAIWWCNEQIRHPSDDEIGAPWWPDGEIGGPRPLGLILFKRFNTVPLHSFKLMGPKIEKF